MVEVEGTTQANQSVLARKIKLEGEDDNDNDGNHEVEVAGAIQSINPGAGVKGGHDDD